VTKPGATSWAVTLPAGTWHDFWTHEIYRGPAGVTVPAPLDRMPLFVRGGAILPLAPVVQYAGEQQLRELTLLVYPEVGPERRSSFTLYEDDGETTRYLDGHFALTELTCAAEGGGAICRIGAPQGDPSVIPEGRRYTLRVRVPCKPLQVEIAGAGRIDEIRKPEDREPDAPAWWMDEEAFAVVRLPPGAREARLVWDAPT